MSANQTTPPEPPKYRGVAIWMDGKEWIVPALSVRQFRDNYAKLTTPVGEVSNENVQEQFDRFVPIIGLALRRNYPELSDEKLFDMLDLSTFKEAIYAVQAASGLRAKEAGEATPAAS
jgi:hypothetical protein